MSLPRRKYLNNHDLMKEIHKSKNSFSSFSEPEYSDYDIIVSSIDDISKNIEEAKIAKAKTIAKNKHEKELAMDSNKKLSDFTIEPSEIPIVSLIFRVMTYDHIPVDQQRKKNPKSIADHHVKLNLPPFQHWKYDENMFLRCVGKSHWKGDLDNGHFCKTHGKQTENLAKMWMKLCERYGTRGNVRSYTYIDEMQSQALLQLTEVGLQFNEAKSNNPFSYSTSIITNSYIKILNSEKNNQNIRDDILQANNLEPSYTRQHQQEWEASLIRNNEYEGNIK